MIIFPRRLAGRLRGVFRRLTLGITTRGTLPALVFRAEQDRLRIQHHHASLAVEYVRDGNFGPPETIALLLHALADVEGPDEIPFVLKAVPPDATVVRWEDCGTPLVRDYHLLAIETLSPFPGVPAQLEPAAAQLIDAIVEASRTCDEHSTRYSLRCALLRGDHHQIAATDGYELLIQGGFHIPWTGDVLVRNSGRALRAADLADLAATLFGKAR
jgi:hypothetical protein